MSDYVLRGQAFLIGVIGFGDDQFYFFLALISRITRFFLHSPLDLDDAKELFGIVTFLDIYGKVLIVIFSSICSRTSAIATLCANRIDDRLRAEIISYKA